MNKGGIQLTLISILVIAASVGLAAALSALTPAESALVGPTSSASQSREEAGKEDVSVSQDEESDSEAGEEASEPESQEGSGEENSSQPASEEDSDEEDAGERQEEDAHNQSGSQIDAPVGGYPGGNEDAVVDGRLPGYEDKEINTNADAFNYLLNSGVTFDEPGGEGDIMVENTPGNLYPMQLQYYLTDTGELIYTSAVLKPGQSIQRDRLSVTLEQGFYDVTATLTVYDDQSMEAITTFAQEIVIQVKRKKFLGIF